MNKVLKQWRKFQDEIGEPPYNYYFLQNLPESEYPKYLSKLYKMKTGERLNLKHPKTFNEKIQWIKLYGITSLMRECTDKVKVRDYVKERIGEEYLKPVLQIIPNESKETMRCHCEQVNDNLGLARQSGDISNDIPDCRGTEKAVVPRLRFPKFQFRENWVLAEYNDRALIYKDNDNDNENNDVSTYFDQINFDKLPDSFVMKTNHGCKWQYIIKNKEEFLKNKRLFEIVKKQMTGYLEQDYCFWGGFELNYKGIEPKIVIEKLLRSYNKPTEDIEVYCFNGTPKIIRRIHNNGTNNVSIFDENFNNLELKFLEQDVIINFPFNDNIKQMFVQILSLSKQLAKDFKFVRADYLVSDDKFYFNELTFTPFSGFCPFDKKTNKKLGNLINLKGNKNEF